MQKWLLGMIFFLLLSWSHLYLQCEHSLCYRLTPAVVTLTLNTKHLINSLNMTVVTDFNYLFILLHAIITCVYKLSCVYKIKINIYLIYHLSGPLNLHNWTLEHFYFDADNTFIYFYSVVLVHFLLSTSSTTGRWWLEKRPEEIMWWWHSAEMILKIKYSSEEDSDSKISFQI